MVVTNKSLSADSYRMVLALTIRPFCKNIENYANKISPYSVSALNRGNTMPNKISR